jgi:hypothetical protein
MRGRHSGGRLGPAAAAAAAVAVALAGCGFDLPPKTKPLVCGTSVTAAGLQAQIFGPSGDPW